MKPVQPPENLTSSVDNAVTSTNDVSLQNDSLAPQESEEAPPNVKMNGHHPVPDNTTVSQGSDSSIDANAAPSSNSLEAQPSTTMPESSFSTIEMELSTEPLKDSTPIPDQPQPPVSNLRTAPHSDALAPEKVADIEAEKHEIDDRADQISSDAQPVATEIGVAKPEENSTGLQTPQSPSSVQPAPTALPVVPSDGVVVPTVKEVDTPVTDETPAVPTTEKQQDQEMTDAPPQPVKAVHQREEDHDAGEPAAKRVKTDEDRPLAEQSSFKVPESPAPVASASASSSQTSADDVVTPLRLSHMKKVISNLKKSNASAAFRLPVDPVALKIPTYFDIVKSPMDLHTIDDRLKRNEYKSMQAFKNDFYQIITNCNLFNGPDHTVTQQGRKMEQSFNNQMAHLPPVGNDEPAKVEKKVVKPKVEPVRNPAPRRSSITAKAASPKATPSPATFAPDPNGMPLIRRDSALDGRPKRAIVPPKRNSDFGGARPKKKKYELELKFCDEVLKIVSSPKHWTANQYFTHPVDPVALNIPTYFQIIKKPMDLGTVRQKLDGGMYEKAKDFEEDVRLIFKNCYKFNPEGDYVYQRGKELENLFSKEWEKKQDWIAAREPESEPASVVDDDDDEDASDEDPEVESEDDERSAQIEQLQQQIVAMQQQMGQLAQKKKKKASPGATVKKGDKKKVKKEPPKSQFPGLKPNKPKKPTPKAKPEKDRYVTFAEKQYISNGIAMLPERQMSEALKIIQNSVPALANSDQNEIELDIEEVPNHALLKLLTFVKKYAGPAPEEPKEEAYPAQTVTKKKGKMTKQEQDDQIASLRGTLHHYQEGGSPDAIQSIETGGDDSEDDESNEESEEE